MEKQTDAEMDIREELTRWKSFQRAFDVHSHLPVVAMRFNLILIYAARCSERRRDERGNRLPAE